MNSNNIDYQEKQKTNHQKLFLKVVEPKFLEHYEKIRSRSMLSVEVLYDLWLSVKYICKRELKGDIVEFGVWNGGGLELIAHALNNHGGENKIVGFDTFEGHPEPQAEEVDAWGNNMREKYQQEVEDGKKWAYANFDNVNQNLKKIYNNYELVKGLVDESIDDQALKNVSMLRLDMDWYAPTKVVLERFYDKIETGGILIIDDYGHHSGARKAIDEFVKKRNLKLNFRHVNYSCLVANIF